jgi:SAM-dependent methyltransferase
MTVSDDSLLDLKQKSKVAWALGDYRKIATDSLPVSAHLIRSTQVRPGESVLDVACGTGVTAITARRAGSNVTGVDLTPKLLEQAKEEEILAEVEDIEWKKGDVEDLPFQDHSFDVVLSSFGHMFASRPNVAAKEIIRVTKKRGRIGFATWPPELAVGRIFISIAKHISSPPPPPNILPSPLQWGIPELVQQYLGNGVKNLYFERGTTNMYVLSPNHYWQHLSTKFGPLIQAIQPFKNESAKVEELRCDFIQAITPYIRDNTLRLDYLLTVATKA